jgi:hypothetical protein
LQLWNLHRTVDVLLYQGRGRDALEHHLAHWSRFRRSLLFRALPLRVLGHWFLARAALGAAAEGGDRSSALDIARQQAVLLERMRRTDAASWALIARAGIARLEGDEQSAMQHLHAAIAACGSNQMPLFGLYVRRNRGLLLGGPAGERETAGVDAELRAQDVVNPQRWVATYAPGFALPCAH